MLSSHVKNNPTLVSQQQIMELVTLQFPTVKLLWGFRLEIETDVFEINLRNHTLTCHCSEQHIKLAVEKYAAKVISSNSTKVG